MAHTKNCEVEAHGIKRKADENITRKTAQKKNHESGVEPMQLFQYRMTQSEQKWGKGKVEDQRFTFTLDYLRSPKRNENLGVEAVSALTQGIDKTIQDLSINPEEYRMSLQIYSKAHFKERGNTRGEAWSIPIHMYVQRLRLNEGMLNNITRVLNTKVFICSDQSFKVTMRLMHRRKNDCNGCIITPVENERVRNPLVWALS